MCIHIQFNSIYILYIISYSIYSHQKIESKKKFHSFTFHLHFSPAAPYASAAAHLSFAGVGAVAQLATGFLRGPLYSAQAMAGKKEKRQGEMRQAMVSFVIRKVGKRLERINGELQRVHSTNRLLPPGGIRRRDVKRLFSGWCSKMQGYGRVITRRMAKEVCRGLRERFGLPVLSDEQEGLEVGRLHTILKVAKKRQLAMAAADMAETLPMGDEDTREPFPHPPVESQDEIANHARAAEVEADEAFLGFDPQHVYIYAL